MLKLMKVSGRSLYPAYRDGDFVLVCKIPFLLQGINPGDVIVFRHRTYGTMIKKVKRLTTDRDEFYVVGMQCDSLDSDSFGTIHKRDVIGKVVWHIRKRTG